MRRLVEHGAKQHGWLMECAVNALHARPTMSHAIGQRKLSSGNQLKIFV